MTYETENLSLKHAVKKGTHDSVSDITRFSIIALALTVAGTVFMRGKTGKKIKRFVNQRI